MRTIGKAIRRPFLVVAAALLILASNTGPAAAETIRKQEWFITKLSIDQSHAVSRGNGVTVAVIDSGVDSTAPSLSGKVIPGMSFGAATSADARSGISDGHGTGMAGIIAGRPTESDGYLGVAPDAMILPIALGDSVYAQDVAGAIRYASDAGAQVINISQSLSSSPLITTAIRYATQKDTVIIAAAGNRNKGDTAVGSPANIPGVVAVGATDDKARAWQYTVSGPEVSLSAPGTGILVPDIESESPSRFSMATGTSTSTAIVSGVAALVRAKFPDMDAPNIINRLIRTAKDQGPTGRDNAFGYGTVNTRRALTQDVPTVTTNPLGEPTPAPTAAGLENRPKSDPTPIVVAGIATTIVLIGVLIIVLMTRGRKKQQIDRAK